MRPSKQPEELIANSPLITGRTDAVHSKTDSPMGSPLLAAGGMKRESKNISDIHKKVLLKNLGQPMKVEENDEISEEGSPIDANIKNMKKEEKAARPSMDSGNKGNSPYIASPLGKKPRGSVDPKKIAGSPLKHTKEVKGNLQRFEEKK